jgi:alkylhydroperoxidase family enzyme
MPRVTPAEGAGTVMQRVMGRRPEIAVKFGEVDATIRFGGLLPAALKEEVRRSMAPGAGCVFCASLGDPAAKQVHPRVATAVGFAQLAIADPRDIDDASFDVLREFFSEEEIVELVSWICLMHAGQMFGALMKLPPATQEEIDAYTAWRRDGELAAAAGRSTGA